jgi:hypothetical protein
MELLTNVTLTCPALKRALAVLRLDFVEIQKLTVPAALVWTIARPQVCCTHTGDTIALSILRHIPWPLEKGW